MRSEVKVGSTKLQSKTQIEPDDCCILNGGKGAWAFAPLAEKLSLALGVPISEQPRRFNYLLHIDPESKVEEIPLFIPLPAVRVAADKRLSATTFAQYSVPTPRTLLLESFDEVARFVSMHGRTEWCLKYPTGCGANGHRIIDAHSSEPPNWPRPFIVQEFIRLKCPEVYRLYCAGGQLFGRVVRRFQKGTRTSHWVAHARGAHYELAGDAPRQAIDVAALALKAAGLFESFGCVDLLPRPSGEWVALEVGTDGLYNHVDRDLGIPNLESELSLRIAGAFWRWAESI